MNNLVKIFFPHATFGKDEVESMWAAKTAEGYQIDNIPFYIKNFALGDIVDAQKVDGQLIVTKLIKENGHSTIRILIADIHSVSNIRQELTLLGLSSEVSNFERLVAVDVPYDKNYLFIKQQLEEGEINGKWEYEEACLSSKHRNDVN